MLPSVGFAASAMVTCTLVSQVLNTEAIDSRCDNGEFHFNPWMTTILPIIQDEGKSRKRGMVIKCYENSMSGALCLPEEAHSVWLSICLACQTFQRFCARPSCVRD